MTNDDFRSLNNVDTERIVTAALPLGRYGELNAENRYNYYRRKGHPLADAVRYTIAWCHNMSTQRARRLDHETGAE